MSEGMSWESIPTALLNDCAQLVKANSIEGVQYLHPEKSFSLTPQNHSGNKKDNLTIIYTPADNLKVLVPHSIIFKQQLTIKDRKQETWPLDKCPFTMTRK